MTDIFSVSRGGQNLKSFDRYALGFNEIWLIAIDNATHSLLENFPALFGVKQQNFCFHFIRHFSHVPLNELIILFY